MSVHEKVMNQSLTQTVILILTLELFLVFLLSSSVNFSQWCCHHQRVPFFWCTLQHISLKDQMDPTIDFRHKDYDRSNDFQLPEASSSSGYKHQGQGKASHSKGKGKGKGSHGTVAHYGTMSNGKCMGGGKGGPPVMGGKGRAPFQRRERLPKTFKTFPTLLVIADSPPEPSTLQPYEKFWNNWGLIPKGVSEAQACSTATGNSSAAPETSGAAPETSSSALETSGGATETSSALSEASSAATPDSDVGWQTSQECALQWRYYVIQLEPWREETYEHLKDKKTYTMVRACKKPAQQCPWQQEPPKKAELSQYLGESEAVYTSHNVVKKCAGPLQQQLVEIARRRVPLVVDLKLKVGHHLVKMEQEPQHRAQLLVAVIFSYKNGDIDMTFDPSVTEETVEAVQERMAQLAEFESDPFVVVETGRVIWQLTVVEARNPSRVFRLVVRGRRDSDEKVDGELVIMEATVGDVQKDYTCDMLQLSALEYDAEESEQQNSDVEARNAEVEEKYCKQMEKYEEERERYEEERRQFAEEQQRTENVEDGGQAPTEVSGTWKVPKRLPVRPVRPQKAPRPGAVYIPEEPSPGMRLTLTSAERVLKPRAEPTTVAENNSAEQYHDLSAFVAKIMLNSTSQELHPPAFGKYTLRTMRKKTCDVYMNSNIEVQLNSVKQDGQGQTDWEKWEVDFRPKGLEEMLAEDLGPQGPEGAADAAQGEPQVPLLTMQSFARYVCNATFLATGRYHDPAVVGDDYAVHCAEEWRAQQMAGQTRELGKKHREEERLRRLQGNGFYNLYKYSDEEEGANGGM